MTILPRSFYSTSILFNNILSSGLSPLPPRPQPKFSYNPQSQYHLHFDQYPSLAQSAQGQGAMSSVQGHYQGAMSSLPGGYHTPVSCYQSPEEPLNSTWSGLLPHKQHVSPVYSCKIFLGGVPWDVTEQALIQAFSQFGPIR